MARQPRRLAGIGAADIPDYATAKAYTGPSREVIADGVTLRVHDGATLGGIPLQAIKRYPLADANYAVDPTVTFVAITALTAPRTITLPLASLFTPSMALIVADETELCSASLPITIVAAGADRIAGNGTSILMASPGAKFFLHSNGANLWTV